MEVKNKPKTFGDIPFIFFIFWSWLALDSILGFTHFNTDNNFGQRKCLFECFSLVHFLSSKFSFPSPVLCNELLALISSPLQLSPCVGFIVCLQIFRQLKRYARIQLLMKGFLTQQFFDRLSRLPTSKASPCPLQIQTPEIELLLVSPNKIMLPKACFLMRSKRWNMPANTSLRINTHNCTHQTQQLS